MKPASIETLYSTYLGFSFGDKALLIKGLERCIERYPENKDYRVMMTMAQQ